MIKIERIAALTGHQNPIYTIENSNKPGIFFSAGNDKGVVEWSLDTLLPNVLLPVKSSVYALQLISDQSWLAIGERSGLLTLFDLEKQKVIQNISHHTLPIFDIRSVEQKKEVLVASEDGTVSVWSFENFQLLYQFKVSNETVRCIAINPEQTLVAFGCKDSLIRIYKLEDYSLIHELNRHTMPVTALQFSPNGKNLLSGGRDAQLHIWDATNFTHLKAITAHMYTIYDIKFHPSKPYFATASRDKSIKIWHAETFKLHKIISREKGLDAHILSVNKLLWESHTEQLISASDDKLMMIWDIQVKE